MLSTLPVPSPYACYPSCTIAFCLLPFLHHRPMLSTLPAPSPYALQWNFCPRSVILSSRLPIWWRHRNIHFIFQDFFKLDTAGYPTCNFTNTFFNVCSENSQRAFVKIQIRWQSRNIYFFHISGLVRDWKQLTTLPLSSPLSTSRFFRLQSGCPRQGYICDGGTGKLSFHISTLVRNWKKLAILPPPSHLRHSKGVSITVIGAFVKVTTLTGAQSLQWLTLYSLFGQLISLSVMEWVNHRLSSETNTAGFPSISTIYTVTSTPFDECFDYGRGVPFQGYQSDGGKGN